MMDHNAIQAAIDPLSALFALQGPRPGDVGFIPFPEQDHEELPGWYTMADPHWPISADELPGDQWGIANGGNHFNGDRFVLLIFDPTLTPCPAHFMTLGRVQQLAGKATLITAVLVGADGAWRQLNVGTAVEAA